MNSETKEGRRSGRIWRWALLAGLLLVLLLGTVAVLWPGPFFHVQSVQVVAPREVIAGQPVRLDVYVTDRANGRPAQARVTFSVLARPDHFSDQATDEHGHCSFEFAATPPARNLLLYSVFAKSDLGWETVLGRVQVAAGPRAETAEAPIFVMTDKPIYQPGQRIYYSAFVMDRAGLKPRKRADAAAEIFDSRNNLVAHRDLTTSDHGNVNGAFDLAEDILTGDYRVAVSSGSDRAEKAVTVKRYVRKRISADVEFSPGYVCPGHDATAHVAAAYFSGPPVRDARLSLKMSRPGTTFSSTYVAQTDKDGKAAIPLGGFAGWLSGKEDWAGVDAELRVDDGGTPEIWEGTLNLYRQDRIAELLPDGGTILPGMANRLLLAVYRPDGAAAPGEYEVRACGLTQKVQVGPSGIATLHLTPSGDRMDARISWRDAEGEKGETRIAFTSLDRNAIRFSTPCDPLRPEGDLSVLCAVRDDLSSSFSELRVTLAERDGIIAQKSVTGAAGLARPLTFKLPADVSRPIYLIGYLKTSAGSYHAMLALPVQPARMPSLVVAPRQATLLPGEENQLTVRLASRGAPAGGAATMIVTDKSILARAGGATPESELSDWLRRRSSDWNLPPVAVAGIGSERFAFMPFRYAAGATQMATNGPALAMQDAYRARLWRNGVIAAFLALLAGWVLYQVGAFLHRHARLWDVLVVLVILVIMAGMLLPALARAREESRRSGPSPSVPDRGVNSALDRMQETERAEIPGASVPPLVGPVRENFPETLLFVPEVILNNGEAQVSVRLADNVTTWHAGAVAVAESGGMAGAGADFTATKPFFIEPDFPVAFIEGDEPVLRITALSSGPAGRATLTLEPADFFTTAKSAQSNILAKDGRVTFDFPIRFTRSGKFRLNVRAECDGHSDAVALPVEVTPNGREVAASFSVLLADHETISRKLELPLEAILRRYTLRVNGAPLADFLSGLEGMLREPYGCFEQTTSVNYPNLMVLEYLKKSHRLSPGIEKTARGYLDQGYQRLLSFEVSGTGGFSLFGHAPADPWLSAYGLMEFHDMQSVMTIDPKVLDRTWRYLQQRLSACDDATRAYAVWAALRSGVRPSELKDEAARLKQLALGSSDPYLCALALNASLEYSPEDRELRDGAVRLAESLLRDPPAPVNRRTLSSACGDGANVETLALAAIALEKAAAGADLRGRLLKNIVKYRSRYGDWPGTHATVLALKALSSGIVSQPAAGEVIVRSAGIELGRLALDGKGEAPASLEFAAPPEDVIALEYKGGGAVTCTVVAQGQIRWTQEEKDTLRAGLNVALEIPSREFAAGEEIPLTVLLQERGDGVENGLVEIGLAPAVVPNEQSLAQLRSAGRVQKYEVSPARIVLYLGKIGPGEKVALPMKLLAARPGTFTLPPSRAYEYYRPENMAVVAGERLVIR